MNKSEYIKNPCRMSSLPYYKRNYELPSTVNVIHNDELSSDMLKDVHKHERFFRLYHSLETLIIPELANFTCETYSGNKLDVINIINKSYGKNLFDDKRVEEMTHSEQFRSDLWVFVVEKSSRKRVALGICEYDDNVKEVVLDWIQVLPEYRGRGIGKYLVMNLLANSSFAEFATVSGDMDNPSTPERLYRACGFEGKDIWHILHKKG